MEVLIRGLTIVVNDYKRLDEEQKVIPSIQT